MLHFFDARTRVGRVDKQLAEYIIENHKPAIFVVNKWDLVMHAMETEKMAKYLRDVFPMLDHVPIAFVTAKQGKNTIRLLNLAQHTLVRATVARGAHDAIWSPDGRSLVFLSDESGVLGVRRSAVGASAMAESLYTGPLAGAPNGWLPDGKSLLVSAAQSANSGLDVLAVRTGGAGPVEPVVATNANESDPTASPGGRWLAYVSDKSGRVEVYVRSLAPGATEDVPVSLDGGTEPVWSRDGKELFYRGMTETGTKLIAARVDAGASFRVLSRTPLFSDQRFLVSFPHSNYDVTPDGKHFIFVQAYELERIVIVQNLGALVRQLAPARH